MFRELLTLDDAKKMIQQHFSPKLPEFEQVPLLEAWDRVLAEDVVAGLDIPPFSRSTVDGYAVHAEDTHGAEENKPNKLKICGVINAGEMPTAIVKKGLAAEIVTGAPLPKGADAVVMVEDTEQRDDELLVYGSVVKDENVMKAGSDIRKGETVLKAGQRLGSREIGVLAAVGLAKTKVYASPRVAVLSTGAEVVEPGAKLLSAKIFDINAHSLSAAVFECGGKPICLGIFSDDMKEIQKALKKALGLADLVVTSGGVSVGPKDFMPRALDALGKPGVIVCGVAIKPGKPVTVASVGGKLVFSLPGHPASALLVFHLLVRPLITALAGRKADENSAIRAFAGMRMFPAKGRRTFVMVRLRREGVSRLVADPVESGASGAITTLSKADGFVEIGEEQQFVDVDEEVSVRLFKKDLF